GLGRQTEVLHHLVIIGPVGVRRQQHHRLRTSLSSLLGPLTRLQPTVSTHTGHHGKALRSRSHRRLHHTDPLGIRQRLVLPQRPGLHHPVAPFNGQAPYVLTVRVVIHRQIVLDRQRRRNDHTVPGLALTHLGPFVGVVRF